MPFSGSQRAHTLPGETAVKGKRHGVEVEKQSVMTVLGVCWFWTEERPGACVGLV